MLQCTAQQCQPLSAGRNSHQETTANIKEASPLDCVLVSIVLCESATQHIAVLRGGGAPSTKGANRSNASCLKPPYRCTQQQLSMHELVCATCCCSHWLPLPSLDQTPPSGWQGRCAGCAQTNACQPPAQQRTRQQHGTQVEPEPLEIRSLDGRPALAAANPISFFCLTQCCSTTFRSNLRGYNLMQPVRPCLAGPLHDSIYCSKKP
jgi:hypothetical protein